MPAPLQWATYLAPALAPLYELVATRVGADLEIGIELTQAHDYTEIGAGRYDFIFVCGLPYVEVVDGLVSALVPVAAPVPLGQRYGGRTEYFSDVVVAAGSTARAFADLRGCRWAFNETASHSGYLVTLNHLAALGEDTGFFREWVDAGFHQRALRLLDDGAVDAAAIDSHLLDVMAENDPTLRERLRVVESLGPSPVQPLVAGPAVPESLRAAVRDSVLRLGDSPADRALMTSMRVERFAAVDDTTYNPIRRMVDRARMAGLWGGPRPAGLAPALFP